MDSYQIFGSRIQCVSSVSDWSILLTFFDIKTGLNIKKKYSKIKKN